MAGKMTADAVRDKVRISSFLEKSEYDMLVALAEKEERPVNTMIRVIIKDRIEDAVAKDELDPVEGYVSPREIVTRPTANEDAAVERYA